MPSLSLCSSTKAAAPVSTFGVYSGERADLEVFDHFNDLASGLVADANLRERRRFRLFGVTAKSTACERVGSLGEGVIETGLGASEGRSVRAAVALDVAVDVTESAIYMRRDN